MPKLNDTHRIERLRMRITQLEAGEEIEIKDIKSLLTDQQSQALDAAWAAQQALRQQKKARTAAEQKLLGWKTKREVRLEALKKALDELEGNILNIYAELQRQAEIRQARIYFEALKTAEKEGKPKSQAEIWANNELTRAGLNRLDRQAVSSRLRKRDQEIYEMERKILKADGSGPKKDG
jgi:hypothetical protein